MGKQILIKPLITEKSNRLSEDLTRYTFVVHKGANKIEIKNAVEKMYSVNVESVNTIVVPGKTKLRNTKTGVTRGRKSSYKKAIVTLATGEEINFFGDL